MKICFRKRIEELEYVQRKSLKALIQEIEKSEINMMIFCYLTLDPKGHIR
jgi:hypothetical protein